MSQQNTKRSLLSSIPPRARVLIALGIIFVMVICALFFAPPEGESNNVMGDQPPGTPTVSITNLMNTLTMNHAFTYHGVQITVTKAMLATKFSDDPRRVGTYTVRVMVHTENKGQGVVGIQYDALARLVLPDGEVIAPKLVSIHPAELPGQPQTGFFDFPVSQQVALSSLALRFGNDTTIQFGS
jgi:hypothetical protein